jgi:hypothetical protein
MGRNAWEAIKIHQGGNGLIKARSVQLVLSLQDCYRMELAYIIEESVEREKDRSHFMSKSNNPTAPFPLSLTRFKRGGSPEIQLDSHE